MIFSESFVYIVKLVAGNRLIYQSCSGGRVGRSLNAMQATRLPLQDRDAGVAPALQFSVSAFRLCSACSTSRMKSPVVTVSAGHKIKLTKIDPDDTRGGTKEKALQRFCELREKISELQTILHAEHRRSLLLVFQAMDTGGKDGAVKDLCAGLNPAGLHLTSFKAPSLEELDHDFLWRIHKAAPAKGMIGIWNRSHYEDVLVARVHKLVEESLESALRSDQSLRGDFDGDRYQNLEVHA